MTVSRTGSTPTPFGFVGAGQYQSDSDSGLQLLGHRMYDPTIGRFVSSDPAKDGTNWYAYVLNNPLSGTDPLGLNDDLGAIVHKPLHSDHAAA
jgi:RHS repeat-associated protein